MKTRKFPEISVSGFAKFDLELVPQPWRKFGMSDGTKAKEVGAMAIAPMFSGFALIATLLDALHCVRVVGDYLSRCDCSSAMDVFIYASGLDEVIVGGLLVHAGILVGLCGATVALVRRK
jgi:hypothetical protein